jgi:N,N'-diacetyllegionaminate synthase
VRTLIIAEAGVNHNGELNLAKKLVHAAAEAGADIVKFQSFRADELVTQVAVKADYQMRAVGADETQHTMIRRLELTRDMHEAIIAQCEVCKIQFLSTGFDAGSIAMLAQLGAELFKIPSGEITNLPLIRQIGRLGQPVILSSGMSTLGEIEQAIDVLERAGLERSQITVLHCNTEYPTPMVDVNLRAMLSIRDAFEVAVGYSDHTLGIEVPIAATALGASVIEKHLTLDRNLPGPDHRASLEPDEFRAMVLAIRNIEVALGSAVKTPSASEAKNRTIARRSIVAKRQIRAGELFSEENIAAKRPGGGLSPMHWDEVIGRRAPRDFGADELIELGSS